MESFFISDNQRYGQLLKELPGIFPDETSSPSSGLLTALRKKGIKWAELKPGERIEYMKGFQQDSARLRKIYGPLVSSLDESLSEGQVDLAIKLYVLLQKFSTNESIRDNYDNNLLLAMAVIKAIKEGKLCLWRYVCMAKTELLLDGPSFNGWNSTFDSRYDTLTPSLIRDKELLTEVLALGLDTEINYVLNDWEVPFYRWGPACRALQADQLKAALDNLESTRQYMREWISARCAAYGVGSYNIIFFSDQEVCPDYQLFLDLVDNSKLEVAGLADAKLLGAEIRFVKSADKSITDQSALDKAMNRIYQYAVEAVVISQTSIGAGIYLNGEYPTVTVWQKMKLLQPLPTLFYIPDSQIRNI
ncbi:MAG: hypothetical protein JNK26_04275 [Candidatus Doudnabacteria bacterium]|nr:hypothetical protein [Candidatus Doudnabacteria bacterium]